MELISQRRDAEAVAYAGYLPWGERAQLMCSSGLSEVRLLIDSREMVG